MAKDSSNTDFKKVEVHMAYFADNSIEESILTECRYIEDVRNASDIEMIAALAKVLAYYTEQIEERRRK